MESNHEDHGAPRIITLDADGLDRLEQVLLGAAPISSLRDLLGTAGESSDSVHLHDGENTPLARIQNGAITPLQPLGRGAGPQWNPALRKSVAEVERELATVGGTSVVALAMHTPPSSLELARTLATVTTTGATALIVAALLSRLAPTSSSLQVGASGVARSAEAAGRELASQLPDVKVIPLVVPWPRRNDIPVLERETEADQLLKQYGATEIIVGGDQNQLSDTGISALLPAASRLELERARAQVSPQPASIFFSGLSGSGKSTIARALKEKLEDQGVPNVVLLDGDEMRRRISQDLGFDRASRNKNVERIAEVAASIAASGGVAIAAPIAPFAEGRERARAIASVAAPVIFVYVSTPLEVCESRDRKGLYAKARAGEVKEFTGISSPYEAPTDADVVIDASVVSVELAVEQVIQQFRERRFRL